MNAEALIGTVLGTCTLQRLIGQGGMGAVYLAQQSRPRRQVAVKVLLPATSLKPHQFASFLERFRRETDAAASLEHPNIMPVHEYGEQDGLAYLVMPYVSGGTLRDVMEQEGPLAFPKVTGYLEQMAAALDFAHERGVIHRDIKPANMLLTPEGRLLLTDFGLVKVLADGQSEQARLTGAGAPVGTPDYMSPEQVMGNEVDGRADLYSLGVILYQMVVGTLPFQGETPMQIAMQHLQVPPAPPRILRADLSIPAEQVMMRAMAKSPTARYARGQEMATAFRLAAGAADSTATTEARLNSVQGTDLLQGSTPGARLFTPKGLFDPAWQTGTTPVVSSAAMPRANDANSAPLMVPKRPTGLLSNYRTGTQPGAGGTGKLANAGGANGNNPFAATSGQPTLVPPETTNGAAGTRMGQPYRDARSLFNTALTGANPATPLDGLSADHSSSGYQSPATLNQMSPLTPSEPNRTTGTVRVPNLESGGPGAIKLSGPVKVVQVPIAGQPGQYITGLLPILPESQPTPVGADLAQSAPFYLPIAPLFSKSIQIIVFAALIALIVLGSGVFLLVRLQQAAQPQVSTAKKGILHTTSSATSNLRATAAAQATTTAKANILLFDSLSQNIHNFPTSPPNVYAFTGGAYHITDRGTDGIAVVLQESPFSGAIGYSLTMEEIKGDDTSINNSFGIIIRFDQQNKGGRNITTFYSFEVVNTLNGEYRFYKYDNSQGASVNPWTELWHQAFGPEFHQGQGSRNINTLKVFANRDKFAFTVNGKAVGSWKDTSYQTGTVGMLVNLNGTEIAFSNMLITRN